MNNSLQKLHALLGDLKKSNKVQALDITRKGNLNIKMFGSFRTILDPNEMIYLVANDIPEDVFNKISSGTHFIDSKIMLTEVPKRFERKNRAPEDVEMGLDVGFDGFV